MRDDLDGMDGGNGADAAVVTDAEYVNWNEEVPEAKVSGQVIPTFAFYVAELAGQALREVKADRTPSIRVGFKILGGPDGSEGEYVWDDLYLGVSTEKMLAGEFDGDGRMVRVPKSADEYTKSTTYFQNTLNRFGKALGLAESRPRGRQQAALEYFAGLIQAAVDAKTPAILDVRIENRPGRPPTNRINWLGLRGPTEPATDKKLRAGGKTALDEAKQRITERQKATSAAASSKTAGALRRDTTIGE